MTIRKAKIKILKINRIYIFSVLCVSALFALFLYINFVNQNINENFLRQRLLLELNAVNQDYQNLGSIYIKKLATITERTPYELGFVQARDAHFVVSENRLVRGNN